MKINDIPLFKDIDISTMNYHIKSYADKSIIILTGDKSTHYSILLKGSAIMQYINEDGQLMTIAEFNEGQTFGGNRLFCEDNHYPMTITSKGSSSILYVEKETIIELCQKNRTFLIKFLNDVASKSDILSKNIRKLKFLTIEELVIQRLTSEKSKAQSNTFTMNISKKEWAESLGIQRTSLSRTLQKMQKKGWLKYKNHQYELIDTGIFGD